MHMAHSVKKHSSNSVCTNGTAIYVTNIHLRWLYVFQFKAGHVGWPEGLPGDTIATSAQKMAFRGGRRALSITGPVNALWRRIRSTISPTFCHDFTRPHLVEQDPRMLQLWWVPQPQPLAQNAHPYAGNSP